MEDDRERFDEIRCKIRELLEEAIDLVPDLNKERALSNWYNCISSSLDENQDFIVESTCSMQDTYEEWR